MPRPAPPNATGTNRYDRATSIRKAAVWFACADRHAILYAESDAIERRRGLDRRARAAMNVWLPQYGRENASVHTLSILNALEKRLLEFSPRPTVASIRIGAGRNDDHDFEVEVEVAPGTIVSARYQSVFDEDRPSYALEDEDGSVAELAHAIIWNLEKLGFATLSDILHRARLRTRKTLASWSDDGMQVGLVDIRFVRTDDWESEIELMVEARVSCLDDNLRPTIKALRADHPDLLEARLAEWRPHAMAPFAAQLALGRQGADGTIDQLILNVLSEFCDVPAVLRRYRAVQLNWLCNEVTFVSEYGHIHGHGWISRDESGHSRRVLSWARSSIIVHDHEIPETVAAVLPGYPVTQLVEHPLLTREMIITCVRSGIKFGSNSIMVEFEQPRLLFCRSSGHVWNPERP